MNHGALAEPSVVDRRSMPRELSGKGSRGALSDHYTLCLANRQAVCRTLVASLTQPEHREPQVGERANGALAVEWDAVDDPEVKKPIDLHQEQSGADTRLLLAAAIPPSDRVGDDRDRLRVVVEPHRGDLGPNCLRLLQSLQATAVPGVVVDHRADPLVQFLARRRLARCELEI